MFLLRLVASYWVSYTNNAAKKKKEDVQAGVYIISPSQRAGVQFQITTSTSATPHQKTTAFHTPAPLTQTNKPTYYFAQNHILLFAACYLLYTISDLLLPIYSQEPQKILARKGTSTSTECPLFYFTYPGSGLRGDGWMDGWMEDAVVVAVVVVQK